MKFKSLYLILLVLAIKAFAIATILVPDLQVNAGQAYNHYSSDIRGALINSGEFKVISNIELSDNFGSIANNLISSKILNKCDNYVLISNNVNFSNNFNINDEKLIESTSEADCKIIVNIESQKSDFENIKLNEYNLKVKLVNKENNVIWQQFQKISPKVDYFLIGKIHKISENEDSFPIANTTNISKQYFIEILADFKLINAKDKTILSSFSETGTGKDVKIVPENMESLAWHHNKANLLNEASLDLANNVTQKLTQQLHKALIDQNLTESMKVYN